jgi:hypothetical protein
LGAVVYSTYGSSKHLSTNSLINQQFKLKDLRSAISKEACQLIFLASEHLGENFKPMALKLMAKDALFAILSGANKVISDNAH